MPGAPSVEAIRETIAAAYAGSPIVSFASEKDSAAMSGVGLEHVGATDRLALFAFGNEASGQVFPRGMNMKN